VYDEACWYHKRDISDPYQQDNTLLTIDTGTEKAAGETARTGQTPGGTARAGQTPGETARTGQAPGGTT
jgi:hypothetical protein